MLSSDAATAFLQSAAVRREVNALMDQPFPEVGPRTCAPLHKKTPAAALDLGRPLASATLVQEFLITVFILRALGWIFIFFGGLILLTGVFASVEAMSRPRRGNEPDPLLMIPMVALFGLGIGGAGVYFGILRTRFVHEMCWFCPHGMIWMTGNGQFFNWYRWGDVRDVFCTPHADRPAIGISFGSNVSWISFSNAPASRLMVEYIEEQASAACMPTVLRLLAVGKSIRFGSWRLSQFAIGNADAEIAWRDVIDLDGGPREIVIKQRDNADLFVPLDEIPFPSLFTALARASFAHARERDA